MTELKRDLSATIAHVVGQGMLASSAGCEIALAVDLHPSGAYFEGVCMVRHPDGIPDTIRRPLGLVGSIAAQAYIIGTPDAIDPAAMFARLQSGELALSPADADMAEGFTLDDVALAIHKLRGGWSLVESEIGRMLPQIMQIH